MILPTLLKKEIKEILRDPVTLGTAIFLPLVMLFIFGYAISLDVEDISMAVYDQDRTQESERLIEAFTASGYFLPEHWLDSTREIDEILNRGKAKMAIVIPPDFSRDINSFQKTGIQIILDGSYSATALIISSYATAIVNSYSMELLNRYLSKTGSPIEHPIGIIPRVWYNPPMKSVNYIVPGLFAVLLMAFPPMLTALAILREKERGTIEQIMVTPLRRHEVIIAKLLPTVTIANLSMFPSLLIAYAFGLPMKGSIPLFFLASGVFLFTSMGMGVFISTLSRNLQQALLITFFILFPVMFLSGTTVPIESMHPVLQYLSYLSPVRYYMEIALGIFLKGIGLKYLWPQFVLIFLMGLIIFPLSLYRLRKRLYE